MACPLTVSKFVGTISLGLLTVSIAFLLQKHTSDWASLYSVWKMLIEPSQGLSFSSSAVTIPSLKLLPTSVNASRSLNEAKRLGRKHALRLTNVANACLLFAYTLSPRHRKHPFLVWMCVTSTLGSYGADYWFNRQGGFKAWIQNVVQDTGCACLCGKSSAKKDEDLVLVEAEEGFNGENVQREMDQERRLHCTRSWFSGIAFAMGVVGLWGDKR